MLFTEMEETRGGAGGNRSSIDCPRELRVASQRAGLSADFSSDHGPYHTGTSKRRGSEVLLALENGAHVNDGAHVGGTVSVP